MIWITFLLCVQNNLHFYKLIHMLSTPHARGWKIMGLVFTLNEQENSVNVFADGIIDITSFIGHIKEVKSVSCLPKKFVYSADFTKVKSLNLNDKELVFISIILNKLLVFGGCKKLIFVTKKGKVKQTLLKLMKTYKSTIIVPIFFEVIDQKEMDQKQQSINNEKTLPFVFSSNMNKTKLAK